MNRKRCLVLTLALALLAGLALVAGTGAAPLNRTLAGGAPPVVAYQGKVHVGGQPYSGDGYFKFAFQDAAGTTSYWSNDGSSIGGGQPVAAVQLTVSDGLFDVLLGDTALAGMTENLTAQVFGQPDRYLRVWFSTSSAGAFTQLTPDTRTAAAPYALQAQAAANADTVAGLHASQLGVLYHNVVVVAKGGGDFGTVQAAMDSITDATSDNIYLVWVAPGVYHETVTIKPYVHLQGAGQEVTIITSAVSGAWPSPATLELASDSSLRDLTVGNSGTGEASVALQAKAGTSRTLVTDATVRAVGGGESNYAVVLMGSGTGITLQQVSALAENGSQRNVGLSNDGGATAILHNSSFTGRGGQDAYGIYNTDGAKKLEAENVTALAENGNSNHGLYNTKGVNATLRGGSFTGRGGSYAYGIHNNGAMVQAEGVTTLAESGGSHNYGLYNLNGAEAILRGGSFTGREGIESRGIYCTQNGAALDAESVTVLAENASNNHGLHIAMSAKATLRGGSFTGRAGGGAKGIFSDDGGTLWAEGTSALGENGLKSYGLDSHYSSEVILRGGSFIGRGGADAYGIKHLSSWNLEAEGVRALGENGSSTNHGMWAGGHAMLRGGSYTGRGGTAACGIYNQYALLVASGITAWGKESSGTSYGLSSAGETTTRVSQSFLGGEGKSVYDAGGFVTISNSRLVGEVEGIGVSCTQVSRGTSVSAGATCP